MSGQKIIDGLKEVLAGQYPPDEGLGKQVRPYEDTLSMATIVGEAMQRADPSNATELPAVEPKTDEEMERFTRALAMGPEEVSALLARLDAAQADARRLREGWLPIVLCPTDGVDRALLLPDGTETIGNFDGIGLTARRCWQVHGGSITMPERALDPIGGVARTAPAHPMVLVKTLPSGVYPTHFRPNDTVYGIARDALKGGGS